jgi:hypothetical protein
MLTDDDLDNLRDLAKRQSANHAERKILAAVAEIERLRSLCDSLADDVERLTSRLRGDDAYRTCLKAKVEIEELRRQRDAYVNEITGSLLPANKRLREEIERLQAQEIRFRAIEQAYLDAAMKDQDEIERLRAALNVENRSRG